MADHGELANPSFLQRCKIYPDRFLVKLFAAQNPLRRYSIADNENDLWMENDIVGPIFIVATLFSVIYLEYEPEKYTISVTATQEFIMMSLTLYAMAFLLRNRFNNKISILRMISVLGYCMFPMVILASLASFINIYSLMGVNFAAIAVIWSAFSACRIFATMAGALDLFKDLFKIFFM